MPEPASPAGWTAGRVRDAKPLRRTNYNGAGAPPRFTLVPGRGAVVPNDIDTRYVPPDCDPTYGDEEPDLTPDETNVDLPLWLWGVITAACAGLVAFAVVFA